MANVTLLNSTDIEGIQLKESAAPSNPAAGFARLYVGTDEKLHILTDDPLDRIVDEDPNDLGAWGGYPDSDLHFAAQDSGGDFWKVRGDEMRAYGSSQSDSQMMIFLDSATDVTRNITGTIMEGHSMTIKCIQNASSNHKILLPVSCGWNGTSDRALLMGNADDFAICVARSATDYQVITSLGVTYAAS
jgi:hypothetical protein